MENFDEGIVLKVKHIPGEPTRFYCEGNSFRCSRRPECNARFLKRENAFMEEGHKCPKCGIGFIEENWHLIDISSYDLNGACSCEWFSFELAPKVKAMTKEYRLLHPKRCAHIEICRSFALDVLLKLHNWEQRGKRKLNPEDEI